MTDKKNNALVFVAPLLVLIVNLLMFGLAGTGILPAITNTSAWTFSAICSVALVCVCSAVLSVPFTALSYVLGSALVYFACGKLDAVLLIESMPVGGMYALLGAALVLRGTASVSFRFLDKIKVMLIVPIALVIVIDILVSVAWLGASAALLGLGMVTPLALGCVVGAILKVVGPAKRSVEISAPVETKPAEKAVVKPAVSKPAPAAKSTVKPVAKPVVTPVPESKPVVVKESDLKPVAVEKSKISEPVAVEAAKVKSAAAESSIKKVVPVKEEALVTEAKPVSKPTPVVAKAVELKSEPVVAEKPQAAEAVAVEKPKAEAVKPVVAGGISAGRDILSEHLDLMRKLKGN
jgi:hypothetical protein